MQFFVSFLAGVILFHSFLYFPFSTGFLAILSAIFLSWKKKYFLILTLVFGAIFAFLRYEPTTDIPYTKDEIVVNGTFESYPVRTKIGTFKQIFSAISAMDVNTNEKVEALTGKEIFLFSDRTFDPGTKCKLGITLLKNRKRLNPGEPIRQETYANLLDIYRTDIKKISLYSRIQECRYGINKYIEENMDKEPGAFVSSITTGETTNMGEELKDAFNTTGLAHILSISGSHFGLFSVFLFGMFRAIIKTFPYRLLQRMTIYLAPSQAAAMFSLPFMMAYLGLSGASIPAVRSFIMISLFLFGLIIGKKGYWLNSLLLAAFIIVAWKPESIFDLSFQLSFLAVLFIGFAVRKHENNNQEGRKIYKYFRDSLLMTLSASLGTAPLVAYYFHYFSVISPVSNLIVAPLIGFLLIPLSVISCFLFLLTGHFIFTSAVSFLSDMSIGAVKLLSHVPYASFSIPAFPPVLLILFYPGLIAYILARQLGNARAGRPSLPNADGNPSLDHRLDRENETPRFGSRGDEPKGTGNPCLRFFLDRKVYLSAVLLILFVVYFVLPISERDNICVTFLDVGQGDSAVVELPDRKIMVIDTGRTGRETASFLKYKGKKSIDVLALSHVHPDHTGGLDDITKKFQVREIWDNGRIVFPDNSRNRSLSRGDVIEGKGYRIYVLHPYREFYTMERSEYLSANNDSLVLKIEGNNAAFLFTGDIEEEAEEDVLHLGKWIRCKVIKVPHHGGKTSAYEPFIRAVSPDVAVISAGRDNSFGHPHQDTLAALQGIRTYRTDIDGAVKISESGRGIEIKTSREFRLKEAKSLSDELKNFRLVTETW